MTNTFDPNAKPGQFIRLNALRVYLRTESHMTNTLGFVYQVQPDGTLRRVV